MRLLTILILLPLLLTITACASKPSSMIASTSPLPAGVRGSIPARGSDCQFHLLGLIPVTSSPDTQNALTKAKRSADVDVLTDVTVDHNAGYYLLFSNNCVRVRGEGVPRHLINTPSKPSRSYDTDEPDDDGIVENDVYY